MHAVALDDLRPRKPEGLSRGAALAVLAHALLVVALSLGVSWRTSEPAGVEAELWAAVPQAAAPRAVEPEPPKPLPPQVQPEPKPEPPVSKVEPPPNRDADIAREKREQKDKLEKQRLDDEKREADKKKQLAEERQRDEQAAKAEADKKKKAEAARVAQAEALRNEQLKRVMGQVGATGAPTDTGTAQQSAGPSASYAGRIKARIKPNVVFADEIDGNPMASVEVKVAPDGTITARRLVKSSGIGAWDDAVIRAIDKTEVLPRDTDGRVPPTMVIDFRPRDF